LGLKSIPGDDDDEFIPIWDTLPFHAISPRKMKNKLARCEEGRYSRAAQNGLLDMIG